MYIKTLTFESTDYPSDLRELKAAPDQLYMAGNLKKLMERPRVTLVGTRYASIYGQRVTYQLARELAEQGVVIVSGLAMGVDAIAHEATLEANGLCIGVLPSPIDNILPVINQPLAEKILSTGGALVSEYASGEIAFKQNFVARNRIMAALGQAVLITEAGEKSGSLHTANFALQQGKAVMVVPGDIYALGYIGSHNLLKSGATPVTKVEDILCVLDLVPHKTAIKKVRGDNAHEQLILDLMLRGITDATDLLTKSQLEVSRFNETLTMLEISGKIRPLGANHWAIF